MNSGLHLDAMGATLWGYQLYGYKTVKANLVAAVNNDPFDPVDVPDTDNRCFVAQIWSRTTIFPLSCVLLATHIAIQALRMSTQAFIGLITFDCDRIISSLIDLISIPIQLIVIPIISALAIAFPLVGKNVTEFCFEKFGNNDLATGCFCGVFSAIKWTELSDIESKNISEKFSLFLGTLIAPIHLVLRGCSLVSSIILVPCSASVLMRSRSSSPFRGFSEWIYNCQGISRERTEEQSYFEPDSRSYQASDVGEEE